MSDINTSTGSTIIEEIDRLKRGTGQIASIAC